VIVRRDAIMSTLSLYFHIPFCHRRCSYCSFYHVHPHGEEAFVDALVAEISQVLDAPAGRRKVKSLYFGGGTPSVLSETSWRRIIAALGEVVDYDGGEITCEVNPEDVTVVLADSLAHAGVNRLSLGIQSMDAEAQRLLGRCPPEANRRAVAVAGSRFDNMSFDVLLGVPERGADSLERTLDELTGYRPAHFSVYCLEPGGDVGANVERFFDAVDPDRAAAEYLRVCERLRTAGYRHYEVSNFARPGRESVHNRVYWEGGDYVGFGPAAHSFVGGRRFHNPPSLEQYLATADKPAQERWIFDETAEEAVALERLMLSLRTDGGVAMDSLSCPQATINDILKEGLAEIGSGRLRLTDRGFLLLNEIALRLTSDGGERIR
jgi:oxygen-independent coproporphyrinogen-3 oxidase